MGIALSVLAGLDSLILPEVRLPLDELYENAQGMFEKGLSIDRPLF
jgi:hypothetical protein